jgi:hypothetical protein
MTQAAPDPGLSDEARARARAIGDAIQAAVSKRPDIAVSPVGMGLDLLSGLLIRDPDRALDIEPWITLAAGCFDYIATGRRSRDVDDLLGGGSLGMVD